MASLRQARNNRRSKFFKALGLTAVLPISASLLMNGYAHAQGSVSYAGSGVLYESDPGIATILGDSPDGIGWCWDTTGCTVGRDI